MVNAKTNVILHAREIEQPTLEEQRNIDSMKRLLEFRCRATDPANAKSIDSALSDLMYEGIPRDIAAQLHIYTREVNGREAVKMSHHIARLRDCKTSVDEFRIHTERVYELLSESAFGPVGAVETLVNTPVTNPCQQVAKHIVPSYKGLAESTPTICVMLRGALHPSLVVGKTAEEYGGKNLPYALFRIRRGHGDKEKLEYMLDYSHFDPDQLHGKDLVFPDPMLATAGSFVAIHRFLKNQGIVPKSIKFMAQISSLEGAIVAARNVPGVQIYTAWMDPILNKIAYICPGLGDAGDRLNGEEKDGKERSVSELLLNYGSEFKATHMKQIQGIYRAMGLEDLGNGSS